MRVMQHHTLAILVSLFVVVLALIQAVAPLEAQPPDPFAHIIEQAASGSLPPGLASTRGELTVIAELEDAPALAALPPGEGNEGHRRQHLARIDSAQEQLRSKLPALGARELYRTRLVYNGIALVLPATQVPHLRTMPGVRAVHVLAAKELTTITSLPFVGAPSVWSNQGATGRGTRIGIIDSGIDYTHAQFGGVGDPAAYAANNRAIIEPGSFPTAKVAGGYDFAGDGYNARISPIPGDDDGDGVAGDRDPLDCNGHGTLVAGTAAGQGVTAAGAAYNGPYTDGLDLAGFRVGPGVAPEAMLYALKVLGCDKTATSTTLLLPALEWAADPNGDDDTSDHLDVVAIALGAPFGSADDPDARAASIASAAGVVVVAAAGNSGSTFYSINSPASAPAAIAVAAVYDTRPEAPGVADSLLPQSARGPLRGHQTTKPDIAAPGYAIQSAAVGTGSGAASGSGSSLATPHVAGAVALLHELHPAWRPVQVKAALLNTATPVQHETGVPYGPTAGGLGRLNIAAAASTTLLAYADDGAGGVGIDYGAQWVSDQFREYRPLRIENLADRAQQIAIGSYPAASEPNVVVRPARVAVTVPPLSSTVVRMRGQVFNSLLDVSPDSTVPPQQDGAQRFYIAEQTGSIYIVGGSNARIRIANGSSEPAVDVYLDGALIASNLGYGGVSEYVVRDAGSYTLAYYRAGEGPDRPMLAGEDPPDEGDGNGNQLGTRVLNIGAGTDVTMLLRDVFNRPGSLRTRTLNEAAIQGAAGVGRVRFVNNNPSNAPLPAGLLDVYLDGKLVASSLPPIEWTGFVATPPGSHEVSFLAAGAVFTATTPLARTSFTVAEKQVLTVAAAPLTTGGEVVVIRGQPRTTIRVPYALVPRPATQATVVPPAVQIAPSTSALALTIRNSGTPTMTEAYGLRPLLAAFELTYRAPATPLSDGLDAARLRYLGVASDYALVGQNVLSSQLFFAIAAQGAWATPHAVEYQINIDTNLDGVDDYVLVNTDLGTILGRGPSDVFVSALYQRRVLPDTTTTFELAEVSYLNTFSPPDRGQPDLTPFDRSVLFMRVSADGLGLGPGASQFRYRVEARHRDGKQFATVVDTSPTLTYDLSQAAIDTVNSNPRFLNTPVYPAFDGAPLTVRVSPPLLAARPNAAMLALHFHNMPYQQAQVVPVRVGP